MNMLKILVIALISLSPILVRADQAPAGQALVGEQAPPVEVITTTVAKLVEIVSRYPGEEHLTERRVKLREVIAPIFDFGEMAKRSLGPEWQNVTPEERASFVTVFSDLLAKTYLARVENIKKDMVTVISQQVNTQEHKALVKSTILDKGDLFPIDYKLLMNQQGAWRVYDVIIENIGLVANYRNEFAGIIRKEKFAGLMKRLAEKSET